MSFTRWLRISGLAVVSLAPLGGEQAETRQDTGEGGSHITASGDMVSLSVQPTVVGDVTRLKITWSGQQAGGILVVSFEEAPGPRQQEVLERSSALQGAFLLRKIEEHGDDTVVFSNRVMGTYWGNVSQTIADVRVVGRVSIAVRTGNRHVKGGMRTGRYERITAENAPTEFCVPSPARSDASLAGLFPGAEPLVIEDVPENGMLQGKVSHGALRAYLSVVLSLQEG